MNISMSPRGILRKGRCEILVMNVLRSRLLSLVFYKA